MARLKRTSLVFAVVLLIAGCQAAASPTVSPSAAGSPSAAAPSATSDSSAGQSASAAPSVASEVPGPGEPETRQITIGFTTPDYAQVVPFRWIEELRADGWEIELAEFESGSVLNRALVADQVDFALASVLSGIQLAQETGGGTKIIASDNTVPDYIMLAPPSITAVSELAGKRLGISGPGDISDVLSRLALQRSGVNPDDVEIVQIGGTNARIAGIVSGQIEAGIAHAAEAYAAMEANEIHDILTIGTVVPDLLQRALLTSDEFIEQNPNTTQVLVDEFIDAIRWAADDKDAYIALSQEYIEGLSDDIRARAYDTFIEIGLFGVNGGLTQEALETVVELNQEIGQLDETAPAPEQWADLSFIESYLARNGSR
jgi:NitT/TauT family transport system substrate-binding protein